MTTTARTPAAAGPWDRETVAHSTIAAGLALVLALALALVAGLLTRVFAKVEWLHRWWTALPVLLVLAPCCAWPSLCLSSDAAKEGPTRSEGAGPGRRRQVSRVTGASGRKPPGRDGLPGGPGPGAGPERLRPVRVPVRTAVGPSALPRRPPSRAVRR